MTEKETRYANVLLRLAGGITKRPGSRFVCEASGPLLDPAKAPKHLNTASIKKWSADSNRKRHLELVK